MPFCALGLPLDYIRGPLAAPAVMETMELRIRPFSERLRDGALTLSHFHDHLHGLGLADSALLVVDALHGAVGRRCSGQREKNTVSRGGEAARRRDDVSHGPVMKSRFTRSSPQRTNISHPKVY